jgi:hypothetical protein
MQESEEMRQVICDNWRIRINAKQTNAISQKDLPMMKECVDEWSACIKYFEDNFGADHPFIVPLRCFLAALYSEMPNHSQQSLRQYQQAKKILDNLGSPYLLSVGICIVLADKYASASRIQESRQAVGCAVLEAQRLSGDSGEIKFHSIFLVLANILVPLSAGVVQPGGRSVEEIAFDALSDFDAWRGALDDTFNDISESNAITIGIVVGFACQLRLRLANAQIPKGQYEEAITNYVRVIQEVNQESTAPTLHASGLSVTARIGLVNLYTEACLPYFGRQNIPDESLRYICELAAEMATTDFNEWWNLLAQVVPLLSNSAMRMFNDPRKGGLQANLQGILNRAIQKDTESRKSQPNDAQEAAVRQGLMKQVQDALAICGIFGRNNFDFGGNSYGFNNFK